MSQITGEKRKARERLAPVEREQQILSGAIKYFAEFGFEGKIRNLAKRLGVSQGLIYRYFPSKDALVDRVYQVVFLNRWNEEWDKNLRDRKRPLHERLTWLYKSYFSAVDSYDVIRISLSSAMRGEKIGINYLEYVRLGLIIPIAEEVRAEFNLPSPDKRPISILEEQVEQLTKGQDLGKARGQAPQYLEVFFEAALIEAELPYQTSAPYQTI